MLRGKTGELLISLFCPAWYMNMLKKAIEAAIATNENLRSILFPRESFRIFCASSADGAGALLHNRMSCSMRLALYSFRFFSEAFIHLTTSFLSFGDRSPVIYLDNFFSSIRSLFVYIRFRLRMY